MTPPANTAIAKLLLQARAALLANVRDFFHGRHFTEVETPVAVICPGTEVHLRYFKTQWIDGTEKRHNLWLRSSPELHLKQALALGFDRIFHLAKCFRNGGELSPWHHPEFTMLEWYQTRQALPKMIAQTEDLIREVFDQAKPWRKKIHGKGGTNLRPLPKKLARFTVAEAFKEFAGIDLVDLDQSLGQQALAHGVTSAHHTDDFETAFFKVILEKIEPGLARCGGGILTDYPASQAALAVVQNGVAKRFEIYLPAQGRDLTPAVEICNGFQELLGRTANESRIRAASGLRTAAGHEPVPEDQDFYKAMEASIPRCCGNALGIDRLFALALGETSIERVVPFRNAHIWNTTLN